MRAYFVGLACGAIGIAACVGDSNPIGTDGGADVTVDETGTDAPAHRATHSRRTLATPQPSCRRRSASASCCGSKATSV